MLSEVIVVDQEESGRRCTISSKLGISEVWSDCGECMAGKLIRGTILAENWRQKMKAHIVVGFALMALSFLAIQTMEAQTVISNETLVTTTFVVNKQGATAKCGTKDCSATASWLGPIAVTCPAVAERTCTFHISLDAKTSISFGCGGQNCTSEGPLGFYQFVVDDAAPTIGPTDKDGDYIFEKSVFTTSMSDGEVLRDRQSYPASVLASVTNANSNSHTIVVNLGCVDDQKLGGCEATAHWSTMRVDVFEP
jgi:hypothetical protein